MLLLTVVSRVSTTNDGWVLIIVTDVKAKTGGIDVAVTPQEEGTEDWLSHNIEDSVEDSLRVGRDDVSTLRQSPGDGVEEPKEDGPDTADEVRPGDVAAESSGMLASGPGNRPCDKEEGNESKGEVTPFIR